MALVDTNIIPVQLDYRFVTTRKIWQYDYGQILSITGQNLPTATEVHFSLDMKGGSTLSRVGTTVDGVTTVKIPDELLKNNGKSGDFSIYAFVYVTDEKSGNTEYRITIPVYSRPKPENPSEDPTPEPNIFHETVTAVNNAADRAEKAVKDTEQIRDNLNLDLSEKITRPQSAKVGQVIAVKEVGTDGKPTDFEAKDMTGGASAEEIKEAVGAYMQEHPFEETDPTVPDWAKQPEKPTYTAEDVGALPDNTKIPTKTSELENDSGFLTSPPTPEAGKILKIKSVNEDGTFVCEWADDGGSNLDVRINGESIVQDGVAEIPISSHDTLGLVYTDNSAGGYTTGLMNEKGRLKVNTASIDDVNKRRLRKEIDCSNFDYAVKAAMCDGKGAAWTAEEQAVARERMGMNEWEDVITYTTSDEEENSTTCYIDFEHTYKKIYVLIDESAIEGTTYMTARFGVIGKNKLHNASLLTNTSPAFNVKNKYKTFLAEVMNTADISYQYTAASTVQLYSYCEYALIGRVGPPSIVAVDASAIGGIMWYGKMYAGTVIKVIGVRA